MNMFKLAGAIPALALVFSVGATVGEAATTGLIDSDRFGYSGTITRHNDLADAKSGANVTETVTIGDRDLALRIDNGRGSDVNIVMGSWWYTTDPQGRAGFGNTRGNTGQGFTQLFDNDGSTDTNVDMSFSNFNGTSYEDFNLSLTGENATRADDFSRLSAIDNVNDGGIFHEYALNLTATGLNGTANGGFIEALDTQPTGVTGSFSGVFELTENQTSPANQGFYNFEFDLSMINWAYENRADLMTQDANGNPIADSFPSSNFIAAAPIPLPAGGLLLLTALGGLGGAGALRRRRKAA